MSISIRGPVTIKYARSLVPVYIKHIGITKSTNNENTRDGNRDSSTMGICYLIAKGVYVAYGSVNT